MARLRRTADTRSIEQFGMRDVKISHSAPSELRDRSSRAPFGRARSARPNNDYTACIIP